MRDGKLYDSINVNSDGTWDYQFSNKFLQGSYDIEIISQDAAGNKSPPLSILSLFKLKLYFQKLNWMLTTIPVQKATGLPINIMPLRYWEQQISLLL